LGNLKNLDKLPAEVKRLVEPYLSRLLDIYGDGVEAVAVYGSATGSDFIVGKSNINMAIVLGRVDVETLKKSLKTVADGRRQRIVAPLFLTRSFIDRSCDVFPLEFIEIKDNHVPVFGEDIFSAMQIDQSNLRLQCEEQLKGSLLRLRQAYLELGLRKKGIESLLIDSLTSIIPAMRGALRLAGMTPSTKKDEVVRQIGEAFGVATGVMFEILRDKQGDEKIGGEEAEAALEKYMESLRGLGIKVDEL
jgi:hypothetical protein